MFIRVRCLLCNEVLDSVRNDTTNLLEHIRQKHPNIKLSKVNSEITMEHTTKESRHQSPPNTHINTEPDVSTGVPPPKPQRTFANQSTLRKDDDIGEQLIFQEAYRSRNPLKPRDQRQKLFKTTIEKWRPGKNKITCPECGATKVPVVKTKTEKLSTSEMSANCLLSLWPFCIVPFLMKPPAKDQLYCHVCDYYFGEYDRNFLKLITDQKI